MDFINFASVGKNPLFVFLGVEITEVFFVLYGFSINLGQVAHDCNLLVIRCLSVAFGDRENPFVLFEINFFATFIAVDFVREVFAVLNNIQTIGGDS